MESTLTLTVDDLEAEVGLFLGYGRGAKPQFGDPAWTTQQQALITSIRKSGERQFLYPPPIEGQESSYDWSFLKPRAAVNFAAKATTIPLPDDFGGFEGEITLKSAQSQMWWPIQLRQEGAVAQLYSETPAATGRPWIAALQWLKPTTPLQGQRAQLFIFPTADTAYTLEFQYYLLPDAISSAFPYALGGMLHVETILESCLAIAEQRLDDMAGVHTAKFNERLLASINADRRNKSQNLGYNRDRSDFVHQWDRGWNHYNDKILIHGIQYALMLSFVGLAMAFSA